MSSVAVFPSNMSSDTLSRPSMIGNRRTILAAIDAAPTMYSDTTGDEDNHAQSIPISHTDALLRSRKLSEIGKSNTSSPSIAASRPKSYASSLFSNFRSNSDSPPTSIHRSKSDFNSHLSVTEKSGKPRLFSSAGIRLRRSSSNLSQTSDNLSLPPSSRRSLHGGLSGLLRRTSRTKSQSNSDGTSADPGLVSTTGTLSRLRSFSSKTSLKLRSGMQNNSVSLNDFNPSPTDSQHTSSAAAEAIATHTPDQHKPVPSVSSLSHDQNGSTRSRRYTRSKSTADKIMDPFAGADATLARARTQSSGSLSRPRQSISNLTYIDPLKKADKAANISTVLPPRSSSLGRTTAAVAVVGPVAASATETETEAKAKADTDTVSLVLPPQKPLDISSDAVEKQQGQDADMTTKDSNEYSSDEEFFDAELADIAEGSEEEEEEDANQDRNAVSGTSVNSLSSPSSSEADRMQPAKSPAATPYHPHGTASASRRAGATTERELPGYVSTAADSKSRRDISTAVREKAARVAKMGLDDVRITPQQLRDDLKVAKHALNLFLNSRMIEAESIVETHADTRLYYALAYALIATIKGFMTFEPSDLAIAISLCKDSLAIASLLRKPSSSVANFGRFVRGTGQSPSSMAAMDEVQKHAELVYAESLLLKAVLGIVYAGDFFAFVSEALNMRNAYGIYRSLSKFVEWTEEKGSSAADDSIDEDFKSGVYLGNGMISMILGLLPGKILKIMGVFGYTGDTVYALKTLSLAGRWDSDPLQIEPGMPMEQEGARRQICDMVLLAYHLVISTFIPVNGVDIQFADKILHYNLQRYPQGMFFLYYSGHLYSTQALSEKAIVQFEKARDVQKEYVQLKHICIWDLALCNMSLCRWQLAHSHFEILANENNWSKAVFQYGRASTLYQAGLTRTSPLEPFPTTTETATTTATTSTTSATATCTVEEIFHQVPHLTQKIAGKSIPMEKFVARKAKKFIKYQRLLLAGVEFSYVYHCLSNAPRNVLSKQTLVLINDTVTELEKVSDPTSYHSGGEEEYYDDLALAHFLRGVCLKFIGYPEPHAKLQKTTLSLIDMEETATQAEASLKMVLKHGHRIHLEHWLVYFAHYELGRLYACMGRNQQAEEQYLLVLSGKTLEDKSRKGKFSLQNMVHLRAHGALSSLEG